MGQHWAGQSPERRPPPPTPSPRVHGRRWGSFSAPSGVGARPWDSGGRASTSSPWGRPSRRHRHHPRPGVRAPPPGHSLAVEGSAQLPGTPRPPLGSCGGCGNGAQPPEPLCRVPGTGGDRRTRRGCPAPGAPGRAETQAGLDGAEAPCSCEPRDGRPLQSPTVPLKCYFPPEDTQTDANFCKHFGNEFSEFGLSAALNG